jgi:hypothetical protein
MVFGRQSASHPGRVPSVRAVAAPPDLPVGEGGRLSPGCLPFYSGPRLRGLFVALAFAIALLCGGTVAADVRELKLPTTDLVYDRFTARIYAGVSATGAPELGVPGDSIAVIDPERGVVERSLPLGSEPGKLALSDDGRYLYVALNEKALVRVLTLPGLTPKREFSVGANAQGPNRVDDMEVMPGYPETVAVSRAYGGSHKGIAIYDSGVPRPNKTPSSNGGDRVMIDFARSPSRLYAYSYFNWEIGFRRLTVDAAGVSYTDPAPVIARFGPEVAFDAGLLYSSAGPVVDPEEQVLVGTYVGSPYLDFSYTVVAPDSEVGRVYFLTGIDPARPLLAFDQQTFLQVGATVVPGLEGRLVGRLIRWGREGLAFSTEAGQLFLVRTSLIPAEDLVFSFDPPTVKRGAPVTITGRIDLRGAAPSGGLSIPLVSDTPPVVAVPEQVTVPEGATNVSFPVQVNPVTAPRTVTLSAVHRGRTWQGTLTVLPHPRLSLALDSPSVVAGESTTGTLTLAPAAPAGGTVVSLVSDSAAAMLPATVTLPAGASTVRFPIATRSVATAVVLKITATTGEVSGSAELTVLPRVVRAASLTFTPNPVVRGRPVTGTVALENPAPPGGAVIRLSSSLPGVAGVPASVTVAAGSASATFPVTTTRVHTATRVSITATVEGTPTTAALTVLPAGIIAVTLRPNPVVGGRAVTGVIALHSPAPPEGALVSLTSDQAAVAAAPAQLIIPAGARSAAFTVQTRAVSTLTSAVLTAAYAGESRSVRLTVRRR